MLRPFIVKVSILGYFPLYLLLNKLYKTISFYIIAVLLFILVLLLLFIK